jgi:hypothetical protein
MLTNRTKVIKGNNYNGWCNGSAGQKEYIFYHTNFFKLKDQSGFPGSIVSTRRDIKPTERVL